MKIVKIHKISIDMDLPYVAKQMSSMEQDEVCILVSGNIQFKGCVVMRTHSCYHFEVMVFKNGQSLDCWTDPIGTGLMVRDLFPGEKYTLELSNEYQN